MQLCETTNCMQLLHAYNRLTILNAPNNQLTNQIGSLHQNAISPISCQHSQTDSTSKSVSRRQPRGGSDTCVTTAHPHPPGTHTHRAVAVVRVIAKSWLAPCAVFRSHRHVRARAHFGRARAQSHGRRRWRTVASGACTVSSDTLTGRVYYITLSIWSRNTSKVLTVIGWV